MRISIVVFLFCMLSGSQCVTGQVDEYSETQMLNSKFYISGQKISSGVSDSFYNIIKSRFEKPERIIYQSYDSILVGPNPVKLKIEFDSTLQKYRGEWKFSLTGVVFQIGHFDTSNLASGDFF